MDRVFAQVALSEVNPSPKLTVFADIVNVILKNALMLAGLLAFIVLVFGGLSVIMGAGSGDTKRMEKGKSAVTGAIIGILVIVASVWIIQIIETITGYSILNTGI